MKRNIATIGLAVLTLVSPVVLTGAAGIAAGPLLIDDFGKGLSAGWEKKVFKGETAYRPVGRLFASRYCTTRQRFNLPGDLPE